MRFSSLPPSVAMQDQDTSSAPDAVYLTRRLKLSDASVLDNRVDEAGLLELVGNKVILGEPGMGKSELMSEIGRRLGVRPVTATRFINAKDPAKLVSIGKPVLVDGLDEATFRREGDAVDAILAQLEEADFPQFILSCRSREWQGRTVTNLRQLYGADPRILTIEPFDHIEAHGFLLVRHPTADADHVLDHLKRHGLDELYRNPLTLGLMGRVAETDARLPATRASLFERVCTLLWPEHDPDRQDERLAQLTNDEALDSAGAIAVGLLLGGAEAATTAGPAQVQQGDIRLAELELLPNANATRTIFSCKLFHSVGPSRAKPIHRVIAEYLGARWLARQAATPRAQRRVLAQLHGSGSVPASLRGLHAWLAYHSPAMAERIIAQDSYGVLRYGETAALTPHLANCLFEALCRLAEDDPYFRAADWDSKTAAGLMIPALKPKIDAIIGSEASNPHLRSLLIKALEGVSLASDVADTLEVILLSPTRSFRDRSDAADALLPYRDPGWWRATIATLTDQGGEDGPHLARQLIQVLNADVSNELLVATMFAEMGMTSCPLPRRKGGRVYTVHGYEPLFAGIQPARLVGVLDLIADYAALLHDGDWQYAGDVADIVASLIVRTIDEEVVGPAEASAIWRWLGTIEQAHRYQPEVQQALAARLSKRDELRRAIQVHVLANDRRNDSVWMTEMYLNRRLVALTTRPGDIVGALDRLALSDNNDPALRQDWQDLVRIAWGPDGLDPDVRVAAEKFRRGDKLLGDFMRELENPKKPNWEIQYKKEVAERDRKRKAASEKTRLAFDNIRDDLRAGKLAAILQPAQAYLGRLDDLPSEMSPGERLATWIGPDRRDDALLGFEAVLNRVDLPTPAEIADGLACGTIYNYSFAIMAGLYERMRSGKGVADLPEPLKQAALLLSYDDRGGWNIQKEKEALCARLEAEVIPTPEARHAFARFWIEPALAARNEYVDGLFKLAHDPDWQGTGAALAAGWLTAFPNVPESVEAGLVDCLTHSGAFDSLREVAESRAGAIFRNFNHMLSWLAIEVLVRFELVRPDLAGIGADHPEFIWFLRNRLQFERHGAGPPLTVAQSEWIIAEFREQWPYAVLEGSGSGDNNDYDATDFLRSLINRIADDTSVEGAEAMARLVAAPIDSYANAIRHMAAEQRQKRAEEDFSALTAGNLAALLDDRPPGNIVDLKALVLEEMNAAQRKLLGDDLDSVAEFWTDEGIPRVENRCRDRLAAMIGPELARYNIQRITEADMPQTKRADLAFAHGTMQLPMEVKGQWHRDVWDAATGQLDIQYLIDWRSEQRGIYCVLWFGDLPSATNRRLRAHPDRLAAPQSADAMRTMVIDRIPQPRRALVDVFVLDLTASRS